MSLPGSIVARWVRIVELEASNFVVSGVHEANTEGSGGAELGVNMLLIAEELDKLFAIDGLVVGVQMSLGVKSGIVDQVVSVGNDTGDGTEDMIVDLVELSGFSGGDEELAGLFLLGAEDNTILSQDSNDGTILIDMLNGVFNL